MEPQEEQAHPQSGVRGVRDGFRKMAELGERVVGKYKHIYLDGGSLKEKNSRSEDHWGFDHYKNNQQFESLLLLYLRPPHEGHFLKVSYQAFP